MLECMTDVLGIHKIGYVRHCLFFLSLLLEKYNQKEKIFVFNDVRLAPTLNNVQHTTGLPIKGRRLFVDGKKMV